MYVNNFLYDGQNLQDNVTFSANQISLAGDFSIKKANYNLNFPPTIYAPTLSTSASINFQGLEGIKLGLPSQVLTILPQVQVPQRNINCKKTVSPEKEVLTVSAKDSKTVTPSQKQSAAGITKALGGKGTSADCNA